MNNHSTPSIVFAGSIPGHYDQYQGPLFFEEYAIDVCSRIDPSSVQLALELSCGTGRVTNHLRKVLPASATLVASDISQDMLTVAKEKLNSYNIDWQIIDSQQLPFEDNNIDLIVCCFGYMFVDKPKAFAEAFRVLKPGGTFIFSTWDKLEHNGASNVHRLAVKKYLEDSLPEMYHAPFSMYDPETIKDQLCRARFSKIKTDLVEKKSVSPSAKEAAYGLVQGGSLYNEIMKRNPAWVGELTSIVENELTVKYGSSPMVAPMRALITEAKK